MSGAAARTGNVKKKEIEIHKRDGKSWVYKIIHNRLWCVVYK